MYKPNQAMQNQPNPTEMCGTSNFQPSVQNQPSGTGSKVYGKSEPELVASLGNVPQQSAVVSDDIGFMKHLYSLSN